MIFLTLFNKRKIINFFICSGKISNKKDLLQQIINLKIRAVTYIKKISKLHVLLCAINFFLTFYIIIVYFYPKIKIKVSLYFYSLLSVSLIKFSFTFVSISFIKSSSSFSSIISSHSSSSSSTAILTFASPTISIPNSFSIS